MDKRNRHIDDLFRDGLGNYSETPPPDVWAGLEKRLAQPTPKAGISRRWPWFFAIVAVIVILGVVGLNRSGEKSDTIAGNTGITKEANTTVVTGSNIQSQTVSTAETKDINTSNKTQTNTTTANKETADTEKGTRKEIVIAKQKAANNISALKHQSTSTRQHYDQRMADNTVAQKKTSKKQKSVSQPEVIVPTSGNVPAQQAKEKNVSGHLAKAAVKPADVLNKAIADTKDKPVAAQDASAANVNEAIKEKRKHKLSAGIKLGYEGGFDNSAARKMVVSPYAEYSLSKKFSLLLQPAIKAANVNTRSLAGGGSYYQVNNDEHVTITDSAAILIINPNGTYDTMIRRSYAYSQSHDSIVKSYSTGGTYVEFELPILLKYKISKNISVYGGPVLAYSKLMGIKEHTYTSEPITLNGTANNTQVPGQAANPPAISSVISYQGTSIANYKSPYPAQPSSSFRVGYMLGFGYELKNRWLADVLIQQSPVKSNVQGGYDINKPFSTPYFRLSLGYKFIK